MRRQKDLPGAALSLRLYIAGSSPNSVQALTNIKAIFSAHYSGASLEVIDVLTNPGQAFADGVIVTPTLLKLAPLPVRRVIGNLSEVSQVLLALGAN